MADSYLVRIDGPKICARFAKAGQPMTIDQVEAWLKRDCGFRRHGTWWLVEEISLSCLEAGEVLAKKAY